MSEHAYDDATKRYAIAGFFIALAALLAGGILLGILWPGPGGY